MNPTALIGALLAALGGHALAAEPIELPAPVPAPVPLPEPTSATRISPPRPLWELGIGVAGLSLPDYRGSDETSAYLLPLPFLVYRGTFLKADRHGARALLVDAERVKVDVSVAASTPTRSRDNVARAGMPNLPGSFELGPNVNISLLESAEQKLKLDLRLPLRAAITLQRSPRSVGATFSPHLNLDIAGVGGGWNVGMLAGVLFADRKYHDTIYGVDAAYATPLRPAYRASGGYAGWDAVAATSRRFGNTWVGAFVRYDNLRGAVFEDSPLVRRSSGVTAGFGVSWIFATSAELVSSQD
jgi:MipA family protein